MTASIFFKSETSAVVEMEGGEFFSVTRVDVRPATVSSAHRLRCLLDACEATIREKEALSGLSTINVIPVGWP